MKQVTLDKVQKANDLISRGMKIKDACVKADVSYATLMNFNKKPTATQTNARVSVVTEQENAELALIRKLQSENIALRKFIKDIL